MEGRYLYLALDVLTILFPLAFSFYPPQPFYKKWKFLWPAILIPAVVFIGWDMLFTHMDVWGFNPRYITGTYFFNLPIEEVLFFICVPYACVFTYTAVTTLTRKEIIGRKAQRTITLVLCVFLAVMANAYLDKAYTSATFLATLAVIAMLYRIKSVDYLGKFYFAFLFILIPFLLVNGILTGTGIDGPIVWYNDEENMGVRIGTIPFEDAFYGMLLLLLNVSVFEYLQKKGPRDPEASS